MKRFIGILVVISAILSIFLYLKLREQRMALEGPAGGSATIEGIEVDVVSRLGARIVDITVEEGEAVTEGQVLVRLDCREQETMFREAGAVVQAATAALGAAEVQVDLARQGVDAAERQTQAAEAAVDATRSQRSALEAQRDAAQRAADRVRELQASGGSSEQALDQAMTQADVLDRQLRALRASISAARAQSVAVESGEGVADTQIRLAEAQVSASQSDLQRAEALRSRAEIVLEECQLEAPRSGIVQTRNFEPGELATPGGRILTLVDTREVRATFYLPNAELGAAEPGMEVELVADAYPDRSFRGRINHVAVSAEFTPRNVQTRQDRDRLVYAVEVRADNPDNELRPGMPVEVVILENSHAATEQPDEAPQ